MDKYIAVKDYRGRIGMYPANKVKYIPAGWKCPYQTTSVDLSHGVLGKRQQHPAEKVPAKVSAGCFITIANNARVIDDATLQEYQAISAEITALMRKQKALIADRFLEFRLVVEGDVQQSNEPRYATKQEATNA